MPPTPQPSDFPLKIDSPFFPEISAFSGPLPDAIAKLPPVLRAQASWDAPTIDKVRQAARAANAPWVLEYAGLPIDQAPPAYGTPAGQAAWAALTPDQQASISYEHFKAVVADCLQLSIRNGPAPIVTGLQAWTVGRLDQPGLADRLAAANQYIRSIGLLDRYDAVANQLYYGNDDAQWRAASDLSLSGAASSGKPVDIYLSLDAWAQAGNPLPPATIRMMFEAAADWVLTGRIRNVLLFAGWSDTTGRVKFDPVLYAPALAQFCESCGLPMPVVPQTTVAGSAGH